MASQAVAADKNAYAGQRARRRGRDDDDDEEDAILNGAGNNGMCVRDPLSSAALPRLTLPQLPPRAGRWTPIWLSASRLRRSGPVRKPKPTNYASRLVPPDSSSSQVSLASHTRYPRVPLFSTHTRVHARTSSVVLCIVNTPFLLSLLLGTCQYPSTSTGSLAGETATLMNVQQHLEELDDCPS